MRILRARMLAKAQEEADAAASESRRSQVRTVDRSERVRTYNFPENRISDHRVNYKAHNLDQVLDGDLDGVVQALGDADTAPRPGGATRDRARGPRRARTRGRAVARGRPPGPAGARPRRRGRS